MGDHMRPSVPGKRPTLPSAIYLLAVAPGTRAEGKGGAYAPADGDVTVHLEDDASGVFQVAQIAVFDLEPDPDTHRGSPPVLVFAGAVAGPGPIAVETGEAVLARILFSAPVSPTQDAFAATAVMAG